MFSHSLKQSWDIYSFPREVFNILFQNKKEVFDLFGPHLLSDAKRPTVFVRVPQRGQLRKICILAKTSLFTRHP